MAITPAGVGFSWSLCGKISTADESLLENESNICYSGRRGLHTADSQVSFMIGGYQDQIYMSGKGSYGVLVNRPLKEVFLGTEMNDINGTPGVTLRIDYDIVTLTTAEQADLYQRGICS